MSFFSEFVYMVGHLNEFIYIKPTLHPCDEAYWIVVNDGFVFLDLVCKNFMEYFHININEGIWIVSFFDRYFCSLVTRSAVAS